MEKFSIDNFLKKQTHEHKTLKLAQKSGLWGKNLNVKGVLFFKESTYRENARDLKLTRSK